MKFKPLPHIDVPFSKKDDLLSGKLQIEEPKPLPTNTEAVLNIQKSGLSSAVKNELGDDVREEVSIPLSESPDYTLITECPECRKKLKRFKVSIKNGEIRQKIVCKNPQCKFEMEYKFKI